MTARRRKTKKHHNNNHASAVTKEQEAPPDRGEGKENESKNDAGNSLKAYISGYPITAITIFVCLPYVLYLIYFYTLLQRPDVLSAIGIFGDFRPAVGVSDERQLLIVGSMSSGTTQMTHILKDKLGLEVGHECSDSEWNFVRDGTVSWIHIIRFLAPRNNVLPDIYDMCYINKQAPTNTGFHPGMYRTPRRNCSYREFSSHCWKLECADILLQEWGCALRDDCEIKFRYNLLQVRNPLRTAESLVAKLCENQEIMSMSSSFVTFANAIFRGQHNFTNDKTCKIAAVNFVLLYYNALIDAGKKDTVNLPFYRIEESSVCDVAKLAGLFKNDTTVYSPNFAKVETRCNGHDQDGWNTIPRKRNRVNNGKVRFRLNDFHNELDSDGKSLSEKLKHLFDDLGYDASLEVNRS